MGILALGALSVVLAELLAREVSHLTSEISSDAHLLLKSNNRGVLTSVSTAVSKITLTIAFKILAEHLVATTRASVASMALVASMTIVSITTKTRVASTSAQTMALAMEELARDTVRVRRAVTSSSLHLKRRTRARAVDTVRDNPRRQRRLTNSSSNSTRTTRARRVDMVATRDKATVATATNGEIEGC